MAIGGMPCAKILKKTALQNLPVQKSAGKCRKMQQSAHGSAEKCSGRYKVQKTSVIRARKEGASPVTLR